MIPILDLRQQYAALKAEIDSALQEVLASGRFILGPNVEDFEREFAAFVGVKHAVGLNSGTDALHLALRALDIGAGDEVITTPFTFAATTEAIGIVGATPVFVDIDPSTLNIDAGLIERAITRKTRALLPVHLYGTPASMTPILEIARRHDLAVIEDCAQAVGAKIDERQVGTFGNFGCFSFFPTKNLGAYGDGGMITTNSNDLVQRIKMLRAHGGRKKYYHEELGINSRLDEVQAAILRVKLPYLISWNQSRRTIARRYHAGLKDAPGVRLLVESLRTEAVYHQYTIRVTDRELVKSRLADAGIQTMVYYPLPLHLQKLHQGLGKGQGSYPVAEKAAGEVLSLPIYPELQEHDQVSVIQALRTAVSPRVFV